MRPLSYRVRTLFIGIAICAMLLAVARYCGPTESGSLAVAYGVEPSSHFLDSFAQQLEFDGYKKSRRPSSILCIDGKWRWYRNETNPMLTIGIEFEHDCLVEIWYEKPCWPFDHGATDGKVLRLAQELETRLRSLLALEESTNQEIDLSSSGPSTFLIGSFAGELEIGDFSSRR